MSEIIPFKLRVPDHQIELLKTKLSLATFPNEVEGAEWDYGVPLEDIKRISQYWAEGYDWRKQEEKLNKELPQFTTNIAVEGFGTLNIHFVYKRSRAEGGIPLLFLHGCECSSDTQSPTLMFQDRAWEFY